MAYNRTRTRTYNNVTGTQTIFRQDGTIQSQSVVSDPDYKSNCFDNVLPGNFHDFQVDHYHQNGGIINRPGGWPVQDFQNVRANAYRGMPLTMTNHLVPSDRPTDNELALKLINKTNPNRADVSIPNFIYELREFPQMLKVQGENWLKKAAGLNLNYQFGWKPFMSDLFGLFDFSKSVTNRMKEIKALHEGGLRRKRKLFSSQLKGGLYRIAHSNGFLTGNDWYEKITTWETRGYIRYFPASPPPLNEYDFRQLAWDATFGFTLDKSTLWEALPWSWMVDWFSDVGDMLSATRNIIPITHTIPVLMDTVSTRTFSTVKYQEMSPWTSELVSKKRTRVTPTVQARLPILTGVQWSILGSLGITRRK